MLLEAALIAQKIADVVEQLGIASLQQEVRDDAGGQAASSTLPGEVVMVTDEQGLKRHHRLVKGKPLRDEETTALAAWHTHQDESESAQRGLHLPQTEGAQLRAEIDAALAQLIAKTPPGHWNAKMKCCDKKSRPCLIDWSRRSNRHS